MNPLEVVSFDVFDTLIGRARFYPDSVFDRVALQARFPEFKSLRKQAEARSDGTWDSIWKEFLKISGKQTSFVDQLAKAEWQTELEETFPIVSVCRLVTPQDIFISDMYITREMMVQLLEKNGLGKIDPSRIFVTPGGKSQAWIWQKISEKGIKIKEHIGDNSHSDVSSPSSKGISAFHYTGSQYTKSESSLVSIDRSDLANLSRIVRLSNPFDKGESSSLWNEFASMNVPFLVSAAHGVKSLVQEKKIRRVLFATRDCCFLEKVFGLLFPEVERHTFYCSRALYFNPTTDYIRYAKKLIDDDTLIVDIHGTGASLIAFIQGGLSVKPRILMISVSNSGEEIKKYGKGHLFIDGIGDNLERLNVDKVGTYFDFVGDTPIHQHNELDESKVKVLHDCFEKSIEIMERYFLKDLKDPNRSKWTDKFTSWCIANFHPETAKAAFVWEPYHFYTVCDLDHRRSEYRKKLGLSINQGAKCPQVVEQNKREEEEEHKQKQTQIAWKSQIGQDRYYVENVSRGAKKGFFLDIGAHNGVDLSNTFVLEKNFDWKGICIEANPFVFESLIKNRSAICVNVCLWSSEEEIVLEFPKANEIPEGNDMLVRISGLQGNDNYFASQFQQKERYKTIGVKLQTVLEQNNCPSVIDYLSIDIEGAELQVLKPFDFAKYHINFIAIEHGYRQEYRKQIRDFLLSKGFKLHRENQFDDEYENAIQKPTFEKTSKNQETIVVQNARLRRFPLGISIHK